MGTKTDGDIETTYATVEFMAKLRHLAGSLKFWRLVVTAGATVLAMASYGAVDVDLDTSLI